MKSNLQPDRINLATFNRLLAQYDDCVPKQLADLEELRLHTIPEALAERAAVAAKGEEEEEEEEEGAYLEKDELKSLVEWKLYVLFPIMITIVKSFSHSFSLHRTINFDIYIEYNKKPFL